MSTVMIDLDDTEAYVGVTVTHIARGEVLLDNHYIGSLPGWATTEPKQFGQWKQARRAVALDEAGTSGDGCHVSFKVYRAGDVYPWSA